MEWNLLQQLVILLSVTCLAYAHGDDSDSSEGDGHHGKKRGGKIVVMVVLAAVVVAVVVTVVIVCICKKKKAEKARTTPTADTLTADALPEKTPIYNISTVDSTNPGFTYGPNNTGQVDVGRNAVSPPPAYTWNQ